MLACLASPFCDLATLHPRGKNRRMTRANYFQGVMFPQTKGSPQNSCLRGFLPRASSVVRGGLHERGPARTGLGSRRTDLFVCISCCSCFSCLLSGQLPHCVTRTRTRAHCGCLARPGFPLHAARGDGPCRVPSREGRVDSAVRHNITRKKLRNCRKGSERMTPQVGSTPGRSVPGRQVHVISYMMSNIISCVYMYIYIYIYIMYVSLFSLIYIKHFAEPGAFDARIWTSRPRNIWAPGDYCY